MSCPPLTRTRAEWLGDGDGCGDAALAYLDIGWCPIPLCPADHVGVGKEHGRGCTSPGKVPLVAGWTSFTRLPTPDEVIGWWRQWPNANVGVVLGAISRMIGLDIDGPAGEAAWAKIRAAGALPAPTAAFRTGFGRRLLFAIPADLIVRIDHKKLEGQHAELRLLGQGSQTVVPPSRHPSGGYYEWTTITTP
jgi:hypothetical protein